MDRILALALIKEAAELGHAEAQWWYGTEVFSETDWQRYCWLGRAAKRRFEPARAELRKVPTVQLRLLKEGKGSKRIVFELGLLLKGNMDVLCGRVVDTEVLEAAQTCVELHDLCPLEAKAAIECWNVVAIRCGLVQDVRRLIARLLWAERAEWMPARKEMSR